MMNFIKNNLANALTLGNLFCGSIAVIHIINNDYQIAAICLVLSLVLDFFDGFVARHGSAGVGPGADGLRATLFCLSSVCLSDRNDRTQLLSGSAGGEPTPGASKCHP